MITRLPLWITRLVPILYKNRITRYVLRPIYHYISEKADANRNKQFRKNGIKVLKDFDSIMQNNHIFYSVFAGTLLGAIREKGLLKHDLDLDTVMFYDDYSPQIKQLLEDGGFKLLHAYYIDDGEKGMEQTYIKDDVSIDIYFVYKDEKYPTYLCDFYAADGASHEESMRKIGYVLARRLELPISHDVIRVPFETIEVNALSNAREWLACRYGSDYLIPNPKYKDKGNNPNIFKWEEVKAIMVY